MSRRRHIAGRRRAGLCVAATLATLAFAATPALATQIHILGSSFGSEGSNPGQFKEPQGVAVNDSTSLTEPAAGDVYVLDEGNNRVERFSPAGEYLGQFNGSGTYEDLEEPVGKTQKTGAAAPTGAFAFVHEPGTQGAVNGVAVDDSGKTVFEDPSVGDVYVTDTGHKVIDKFSPLGEYLGQLTGTCEKAKEVLPCAGSKLIPFNELDGVAVDLAGALWVSQSQPIPGLYENTKEIDTYSDAVTAEFIAGQELKIAGAMIPGFAVGLNDALYVHLAPSGQPRTASKTAYEYLPGGPGQRLDGEAPHAGVAVNLSTNESYIDDLTAVHSFDAVAGTALLESFGFENLTAGTGIAVNSSTGNALSNSVYVADGVADRVDVFPFLDVPSATTAPASNVEVKREAGHAVVVATLNGEVNPNGLPVTECVFEYGTSTSYGHSAPCKQSESAIGSGSTPVPVSAEISNLLADTTYHFRLRAENKNDAGGNPNPGADETFPTPGPSVVSEAPASEVKANTATLSGEINPGGLPLSACEFEYGTKSEYEATGVFAHSIPCEHPGAAELGEGTSPVAVHADLTGLRGSTVYSFRLVAGTEVLATKESATVAGAGHEFATLTVPVIEGAKAEEVTAGGGEVQASVNPKGLQVTHCAFEYGTTPAYGASVRCAQKKSAIGAGTEPVPVSALLTGLSPNVTYHWRLSVSDANGEAFDPDHTFVYTTAAPELPDHRAYEMVTPVHKNGGLVGDIFDGFPPNIAEDGSRLIALDIQCFAPAQSCNANRGTASDGEPFEFTRTPAGWATTALAPPAQTFGENSPWEVNADDNDALFSMPTGPAGEDEWYARTPAPEPTGSFTRIGPATSPGSTGINPINQTAKKATADLSHIVWELHGNFFPFWPFDATERPGPNSLYEYAGSGNTEPFLVGVTGGPRSTELISVCGMGLGGESGVAGGRWGALSADGRTVYFTAEPAHEFGGHQCRGQGTGANATKTVPVRELYARVDGEQPDAHTIAISQPDAPETLASTPADANCTTAECQRDITEPANWRNPAFGAASEDGSRVFFLDTQKLTDQATQGTGNAAGGEQCSITGPDCNLYLYDFDQPTGHNLIDVSVPATTGETPRVQGVVATSADGSHVYFVAKGTLTTTPNAEGQSPRPGQNNLYLYERDAANPEGHIAFVAALPTADNRQWESSNGYVNVTPDGRYLVFESYGTLTPDDTRTDGSTQIFRYDADPSAEEQVAHVPQLIRVSIGADGFNDDGNAGTGNATIVPPSFARLGSPDGDPTMSNDGSYVFFQSPVGLTPHALNDVPVYVEPEHDANGHVIPPVTSYAENVYEWHEGHVYLISDGRDTTSAITPCKVRDGSAAAEQFRSATCLIGTDATGANVFFFTADQLVPKDTDTQVDIYDARVCEPEHGNPCIAEPPPVSPPCLGEQCHGIPEATPSLLAPGTASFNGEGNVPSSPPPAKPAVKKKTIKCKRGFTKKKNKCVRSKKRAKKSSKSKRG